MAAFQPFHRIEGHQRARVALTCEHASNALPPGWRWDAKDRALQDTHWAFDLGAKDLTLRLASALQAPAIIANFSRLFADANRPLDSATLFRNKADGATIGLNAEITGREREGRLQLCYHPYHQAIDGLLKDYAKAQLLLSVHTFTPVYEGTRRRVGVGVLYESDPHVARHVYESLLALPIPVRLNEPYSGKDGFMYSASLHAGKAKCEALEIEVRQDLLEKADFRDHLLQLLGPALK